MKRIVQTRSAEKRTTISEKQSRLNTKFQYREAAEMSPEAHLSDLLICDHVIRLVLGKHVE